ncbi:MAG: hypothetical protein KAJ19_17220, partial [Gammaproteobacteria bacterium]|nr:hypothetical protein [Gammaproteobacteria bacterium]
YPSGPVLRPLVEPESILSGAARVRNSAGVKTIIDRAGMALMMREANGPIEVQNGGTVAVNSGNRYDNRTVEGGDMGSDNTFIEDSSTRSQDDHSETKTVEELPVE